MRLFGVVRSLWVGLVSLCWLVGLADGLGGRVAVLVWLVFGVARSLEFFGVARSLEFLGDFFFMWLLFRLFWRLFW